MESTIVTTLEEWFSIVRGAAGGIIPFAIGYIILQTRKQQRNKKMGFNTNININQLNAALKKKENRGAFWSSMSKREKGSLLVLLLSNPLFGAMYGTYVIFQKKHAFFPDTAITNTTTQNTSTKQITSDHQTLTHEEKEKIKEESLIYNEKALQQESYNVATDTGSEDDNPPLFS